MSEFTSGHPAFEQLLAVIDREPISYAARRHAHECGKCCQEMDDCRMALGDYAEYEEALILPTIAPPERPWLDIRMAIRELDASRNRQPVKPTAGSRIRERLGTMAGRIAGGGVAIGCVAFATIILSHHTEHPAANVAPRRPPVAVDAPVVSKLDSRRAVGPPRLPVDAGPPVLESPINIEVRVFAALHRLGADLGEPFEVEAVPGGRVAVGGAGIPLERQAEVREALATEPSVLFRFSDAPLRDTRATSPATRFEAAHSPLESQLRSYARGDGPYQDMSDHVLDESDTILAHAHALQTLQQRFRAESDRELGDRERAMLREMQAAHQNAFREHARILLGVLKPLAGSLGAPTVSVSAPTDPLDAAQRMDRVLSAIFGAARTDLTSAQLLSELSTASAGLSAAAGGAQ